MLVCYRTYLAGDISPINATRKIISGFEGLLDSWLKAEIHYDPVLIPSWETSVVMNPNNTTYMDPHTSLPVNNMIGCLMHGILVNFCGYPQINNELAAVTLTSMKLTNMQHFDEYFMEYLHRLHTLSSDMILNPKWK